MRGASPLRQSFIPRNCNKITTTKVRFPATTTAQIYILRLMKQEIKLIKNRSDIGAGTRGSDLGIDAIEIAAINSENDFFNRYSSEDIATDNETIYNKVRTSFAKRIRHVHEQCIRVSNHVQFSLLDNYFPIVLSGDHSSSLGTISGIKAAYPQKKIGVVWLDAHADLHSPYTSPSGNVHGMPIAAVLGEDNVENKRNSVSEDTKSHWEAMKNLRVDAPKVTPNHLVYFGVRDTEEEENIQIDRLGIRNYTVEEFRHRGGEICIQESLNQLNACDLLYVSFDVDCLDCHMISNGTGTPVPKGFDHYEVMDILKGIIQSKKVCCLEVSEVNPLLDTNGNSMAEVAFEVLDTVIPEIEKTLVTQSVLS